MRRTRLSTVAATVAATGALVAPALVLSATTDAASAATTPLPKVSLDQSVSGSFAETPMWQTNNTVRALAVSKGIVYAGGNFTKVRPPGAEAGTNETARTYLAAFNASTGALVTRFDTTLNNFVDDIAVSPDGSRIYVAGAFSKVDGVTRRKVAALDASTGDLITSWAANANGNVVALDTTPTAVYAAGDFTRIKGVDKGRFAKLDLGSGAVDRGFTADLDVRAGTVEAVPERGRVLVGGSFNTVNGVSTGGMASVDPDTGALEQWQANASQPINILCAGRVTDIVAVGDRAYVTGEGDPPGCYEGTYQADISDGRLRWHSSCLGASQGITVMKGVLYKASHQHDCAFTPGDARGGFVGGTSRETFVRWHLVAQNVDTGEFMHWNPDTNGSGNQPIGPHVIRNDGSQIFVGGDFTKVDKVRQQGLVRYGPANGATPVRPQVPTVQATGAGHVTVTWPATYDADNGTLTYRLYRGSSVTGTPVYTTTVESWPWSQPMMRFDEDRPAGSTASYRLTVSDGVHTSKGSSAGKVTVADTDPADYATLVRDLGADSYWNLDDTDGDVADSSGKGFGGLLVGGATPGVPGAFRGTTAVRLDGTSGHLASDRTRLLSPSFSQSVWFRTTSIDGGSLLAVTDVQAGDGSYSDRAVTMDNNGNLVFSVHRPASLGSLDPLGPRLNNVRLQGPVYNDGRWHLMVASWDNATGTATLYVDGTQLFQYVGTAGGLVSGYTRLGYTDLAKEQAVFGRNFYDLTWPASEHFEGDVDEMATFPSALKPAQVAQLFAAGVHQGG